MGAGIAYAAAQSGIDVWLKDVSLEAAERGKAYAEDKLTVETANGRMTPGRAAEILDRIIPCTDLGQQGAADLVIEAVFEDAEVKGAVFKDAELNIAADAILASNTSTLPITQLAEGLSRPSCFIGLHFFSPVDKMALVEIIAGKQTSDATLAKAFDVVEQLGKTPIVVNDSRGFFTSRVILQRLIEAAAMLAEGVPPNSIEQASTQAGYPVGTLALLDELSLGLPRAIRSQFREAAEASGVPWRPHPGDAVLDQFLDQFERPGRAAGAGFYDYINGRRAGFWSELGIHFPPSANTAAFSDLRERLLFAEVLEAVRCLDEDVVRSAEDANIGSLLGIGFPAWTGGVVQYVNGYPGGISGFAERCRELADRYGDRFEPPASLDVLATTRGQLG
jgi:3-hydroxyacyl-CoA dehydrogenase/enoyl-CoA hydratase/3-hydroxybutyryl-CoA epimerase